MTDPITPGEGVRADEGIRPADPFITRTPRRLWLVAVHGAGHLEQAKFDRSAPPGALRLVQGGVLPRCCLSRLRQMPLGAVRQRRHETRSRPPRRRGLVRLGQSARQCPVPRPTARANDAGAVAPHWAETSEPPGFCELEHRPPLGRSGLLLMVGTCVCGSSGRGGAPSAGQTRRGGLCRWTGNS
jgi:hypothetical protein